MSITISMPQNFSIPRVTKQKILRKKGRAPSSTRWLERHINDPYVQAAKRDNYRSRSAYKLLELNEKYQFLFPGSTVVDLGAAPGGWCQVVAQKIFCLNKDTNKNKNNKNLPNSDNSGQVLGVDMLPIDPIQNVQTLIGDMTQESTICSINTLMGGRSADVVLSDMAPSTCGHTKTDHLRILYLCETALCLAQKILAPNGVFISKVFQGGAQADLLYSLKHSFKKVAHMKPMASRKQSSELYVVATGFVGFIGFV